jgi:hypothetical protein
MAEPIQNGDEQLNITPLLTKFTDFATKHAYFWCQRFAEFVQVLLRIGGWFPSINEGVSG